MGVSKIDGFSVGASVGLMLGLTLEIAEEAAEGTRVGTAEGTMEGIKVGSTDDVEGTAEGANDGLREGGAALVMPKHASSSQTTRQRWWAECIPDSLRSAVSRGQMDKNWLTDSDGDA